MLDSGKAEINQSNCNTCGICVDACAQSAIVYYVPVSEEDLSRTFSDLTSRIEKALQKTNTPKSSLTNKE